jgi:hypothetical protein
VKSTSCSSILRRIVTMTVREHDKPVEMSCKHGSDPQQMAAGNELIMENSRIVVARRRIIELQVVEDFIHTFGGLSCNVALWPAPFALSTKQLRFAKRTTSLLTHRFIVSCRFDWTISCRPIIVSDKMENGDCYEVEH